jgi:hypothetical protein
MEDKGDGRDALLTNVTQLGRNAMHFKKRARESIYLR